MSNPKSIRLVTRLTTAAFVEWLTPGAAGAPATLWTFTAPRGAVYCGHVRKQGRGTRNNHNHSHNQSSFVLSLGKAMSNAVVIVVSHVKSSFGTYRTARRKQTAYVGARRVRDTRQVHGRCMDHRNCSRSGSAFFPTSLSDDHMVNRSGCLTAHW
jgi:hypothetical protein